jgi:4,5-dihydroxyphthalate decarboxylase
VAHEARRGRARADGRGFLAYGFAPNRETLATFLRYHQEQGLSKRRLTPEELFAPETLESFKV